MALRAIFSSDKEREKELPKLNKNPEMEALKFAIDHHAKIINMSFSGKGFSQQEESLIKKAGNAGILVVVSANNDNRDLDSDQYKSYPASYTNLPNMIVVGGIGKNNKKHYSSNFGKETVDVFAPGSRIKCPSINHEYRLIDGTSPAAALVSGVAALLFSANPKLTPEQVRLIIMSSAVRLPDLQGLSKTDATVNAKAALDLLKNYDNNSNKTIAAN
jgi:subtilisin family serine protease